MHRVSFRLPESNVASNVPELEKGRWQAGSIAQWLEHWSCKPGVASSILAGASCALVLF